MPRTRNSVSRPRALADIGFTLGWELEANRRASRYNSEMLVLEHDGSVTGDSAEYKIRESFVTSPDKVLEALRELVADASLRVDRSCGFHVHIGLHGRGSNQGHVWASWMVQLARTIEDIAFQAVPESRRNNRYCRRYNGGSYTHNRSVQAAPYYASKYSNDSRYYWVNVVEMFRPGGIKTVEIRLLGNTRRFTYLLGWIGACNVMARAAWRLTFDPSALWEEQERVKKAFEKVRDGIMPNTDAQTCVTAANVLAGLAGYQTRVSLAPTQNATTRTATDTPANAGESVPSPVSTPDRVTTTPPPLNATPEAVRRAAFNWRDEIQTRFGVGPLSIGESGELSRVLTFDPGDGIIRVRNSGVVLDETMLRDILTRYQRTQAAEERTRQQNRNQIPESNLENASRVRRNLSCAV